MDGVGGGGCGGGERAGDEAARRAPGAAANHTNLHTSSASVAAQRLGWDAVVGTWQRDLSVDGGEKGSGGELGGAAGDDSNVLVAFTERFAPAKDGCGGGGWPGGKDVGDGSGDDGDDGGSDHGVGDAVEGGKGDRGIRGSVTGLLPAEVLSVLVRRRTMPAWAC